MIRASAREHALQNEREGKCFRAALEMRSGLTTEQAELLQELYERLAYDTRRQYNQFRIESVLVEAARVALLVAEKEWNGRQ